MQSPISTQNPVVRNEPQDESVGVHTLFELQAQHTPDAIAIETDSQQWSFSDLNEVSNHLADHLRSRGVGPESIVGIMMERSAAQIIASLAVLKAGGAYSPLPSADPSNRLDEMLADIKPSLLLTDASSRSFADERSYGALDIPQFVEEMPTSPNPAKTSDATHGPSFVNHNQACAVLFTSGSTGKPKGVVLTHRNIVGFVLDPVWSDGSFQKTLMQAANTFDIATFEMWMPLAIGATIVVAPPGVREPRELSAMIQRHQVTGVLFATGLFNVIVDEQLHSLDGLRALWAGGERASAPIIARALRKLPDTKVGNGYGPTEATTLATFHLMDVPPEQGKEVPIGRPLNDKTVHLLSENFDPVPEGDTGELFVAGDGVSRGYLNRPRLTAEKFIPNPLGESGSRMYRTGDLASRAGDEPIRFVGRTDDQIKLRGFRIELGEISAVIGAQPGVGNVAVGIREDVPGRRMLVAYVVPKNPHELSGDQVKADASLELPSYMVPTAIVLLDALPLTRHGKVDMRALRQIELPLPRAPYEQPQTETEIVVAGVFQKLLGSGPVGLSDDFFALGGDSLLAMRAVSSLREQLGIDLSMSVLFQRPLVNQIVEDCDRAGLSTGAIPKAARADTSALSSGQRRLWYLEQSNPGSSEYVIPYALRLQGLLDIGALERAFQMLIARHEVLRTRIVSSHGVPSQIVETHAPFALEYVDVRGHGTPQTRSRLAVTIASEMSRTAIDIRYAPHLRAKVVQLDETDHVLILTIHHIAADAWSLAVIAEDLAAFYEAAVIGELAEIEPLPLQYADFAAWQLERQDAEAMSHSLAFWESELRGASILELPSELRRPRLRTTEGETRHFSLTSDQSSALRALGREHGATLYMTLLTAFHVFLARSSGHESVTTGSPVANRPTPDLERLIGFFANTIAFQSKVSPDDTFLTILERIKAKTITGIDHQEVPFDRVVERLQPARDPSRQPLFQVMFVLENAPEANWGLSGIDIAPFKIDETSARFDLTFYAEPDGDGLSCRFVFASAVLEGRAIDLMVKNFCRLLESIVETPTALVADLHVVDEEELAAIRSWESPHPPKPAQFAHQYIAEQARERPTAVAAVQGGKSINYAELDAESDALAEAIRAYSTASEIKVGTFVPQGISQVVCLLGILKAGAVYVPFSNEQPRERTSALIAEAGLSLLLTESTAGPEPEHDVDVLMLDRLAGSSLPSTAPHIASSSAAYLMFTSGSTGKPKGVVGTHGGLSNYISATRELYRLQQHDNVLQLASTGYDASLRDMLVPLSSGATIVFLPLGHSKSPESVAEAMRRHRVNALVSVVPSMLREYSDYSGPQLFDHVKLIASSGESYRLAGSWKSAQNTALIYNQYGPTECSMTTTIRANPDEDGGGIDLVGQPIAGTQVLVLDATRGRCATGVAGDIYISGSGVSRGYSNAPRATAEYFVPNPHGAFPGERMYRTGDRGKWSHRGEIGLLGRSDRQVKVRGNRVELGELDHLISSMAGVGKSAVKMSDGATPVILAFAELEAGDRGKPDEQDIRRFLAQRVPDFMLPASIVIMPTLPTTLSGKVDLLALSGTKPREVLTVSYSAPTNATEQRIAEIWGNLLELDRVGIYDEFFAVGGHSLMAMRVISRIRSAFSVEISVPRFLANSTVAAQARLVGTARASRLVSLFELPEGDPPASAANDELADEQ